LVTAGTVVKGGSRAYTDAMLVVGVLLVSSVVGQVDIPSGDYERFILNDSREFVGYDVEERGSAVLVKVYDPWNERTKKTESFSQTQIASREPVNRQWLHQYVEEGDKKLHLVRFSDRTIPRSEVELAKRAREMAGVSPEPGDVEEDDGEPSVSQPEVPVTSESAEDPAPSVGLARQFGPHAIILLVALGALGLVTRFLILG
jgi:hypothetical protein